MTDERTAMLLNQPFVFGESCRLVDIYIVLMENLPALYHSGLRRYVDTRHTETEQNVFSIDNSVLCH